MAARQRCAAVRAEIFDRMDGAGGVAFRDVMTLTLSADHRVVYGADGARFLSRLCELLARPLVLTLP